jgi:hypothetical protein
VNIIHISHEADRDGKPPVRDCSCRGDDAGFAYIISCIVDHARRKSNDADNPNEPIEFSLPWMNCPTCKQSYQHQLRIDLSDEFKLFVDEQFPECGWRHLALQIALLATIAEGGTQKSKERDEVIIDKSISVIHQLSMQPY